MSVLDRWDFLKTVRKGNEDEIQKFYRRKDLTSTVSGVDGGYTVPIQYNTAFMGGLGENSILFPRSTILPMTSKQMILPYPKIDSTAESGLSPFFGGIRFYWNSIEGSALNQDEPQFNATELVLRDLIGIMYVSNQLLADLSEDGEKALINLFARAAAWHAEYAFFNGNGENQPLGIINAGGTKSVTRVSSGNIADADVSAMFASLPPFCIPSSIWVVSPTGFKSLSKINDFVKNQYVEDKPFSCCGSLLSRPVFVSEKLPALGSTGDLMLVDPSSYAVGKGSDVFVEISQHPRFQYNQSVFRVWFRVDGKPFLNNLVTFADASSTGSPFVILA